MAAGLLESPPYAPRPRGRRLRQLLVAGLIVVGMVLTVAVLRRPVEFESEAVRASRIMTDALKALAAHRRTLDIAIDPTTDPSQSGLIGIDYSDLTTTLGDLRAKQLSVQPAFAALIVTWLKDAGVRRGDRVALSLTGSFPGLNIAALSACEAMGLEALVISSIGASSYGANIPGFTWLDMERYLVAQGLVRSRTRYASLGGIVDTEGGLDGQGYVLAERAIDQHGASYLRERGVAGVVHDIERRWGIYSAGGLPKAFINVGGGVTALGWAPEAALLDDGLLRRAPVLRSAERGLIFRMLEAGVPVIHLINIERLVARNHLSRDPMMGEVVDRAPIWRLQLRQLAVLLLVWLTSCAYLIIGGAQRRRL